MTGNSRSGTLRVVARMFCGAVAIACLCGIGVPTAEANLIRGISRIVMGVLQIPVSVLTGTVSGPPLIGTVFGLVNGTFQGVGLVANGALELAMDGVTVAKTVAPFLLPFLL